MIRKLIAGAAALVLCLVLAAASFGIDPLQRKALPPAFVKVIVGQGHGSAVHIGSGLFLTAAHVVDGGTPKLVNATGASVEAEVLWSTKPYDIALVRIPDASWVSSAPLLCHGLRVGDAVTAHGNPLMLDDLVSSGQVAGKMRKDGFWNEVLPVDMTILPGMSGGGVVDAQGRTVGITVGVATMGFGSPTGFGLIVPAATICKLLGR